MDCCIPWHLSSGGLHLSHVRAIQITSLVKQERHVLANVLDLKKKENVFATQENKHVSPVVICMHPVNAVASNLVQVVAQVAALAQVVAQVVALEAVEQAAELKKKSNATNVYT